MTESHALGGKGEDVDSSLGAEKQEVSPLFSMTYVDKIRQEWSSSSSKLCPLP